MNWIACISVAVLAFVSQVYSEEADVKFVHPENTCVTRFGGECSNASYCSAQWIKLPNDTWIPSVQQCLQTSFPLANVNTWISSAHNVTSRVCTGHKCNAASPPNPIPAPPPQITCSVIGKNFDCTLCGITARKTAQGTWQQLGATCQYKESYYIMGQNIPQSSRYCLVNDDNIMSCFCTDRSFCNDQSLLDWGASSQMPAAVNCLSSVLIENESKNITTRSIRAKTCGYTYSQVGPRALQVYTGMTFTPPGSGFVDMGCSQRYGATGLSLQCYCNDNLCYEPPTDDEEKK